MGKGIAIEISTRGGAQDKNVPKGETSPLTHDFVEEEVEIQVEDDVEIKFRINGGFLVLPYKYEGNLHRVVDFSSMLEGT